MIKPIPVKNGICTTSLWLLFCFCLVVLSLGLSWQLQKNVNFFYDFWHEQLNIEQTIKTYGSQNTQGKQDFANTEKAQHLLSFSEIVDKIHQNGKGLSQLSYININQQKRMLLTNAEVVHLQDVSELINRLSLLSLINLLVLFVVVGVIYRTKSPKPKRKNQYIAIAVPISALIILFSVFGFTDIFYYLHTVVFPDNHQWFFYYQESLMSSLMKAPDLFAAIGFTLSVIALIIYMIFYRLLAAKIFTN